VRVSEAERVRPKDFNWDEGTVIVLGKGNCYRKALAGNDIVKGWFSEFVQILSSGLLGVFDEFLKTCV
jgi:site-specific recombinase XerC